MVSPDTDSRYRIKLFFMVQDCVKGRNGGLNDPETVQYLETL